MGVSHPFPLKALRMPHAQTVKDSIPASSTKFERVFTTEGNIVTAKRNQLAPKKVESLIVIKENMAMVEHFLKIGSYEIEKYEDNSMQSIGKDKH